MENGALYILSVEAKDIYGSIRQGLEDGFGIRDKSGNISVRKFINSLDYSLDSIKLREVYEKKQRKKDFSFSINGKDYTKMVINVTFKYSYKLFNKVAENIFIRDGYNYRDCEFHNCVCIKNDKLIGIKTNTDISKDGVEIKPIDKTLLENCFDFDGNRYVQRGTIPVIKNKAELRQYLYENGFKCDGLHYVRYKRSAGSSRVGKCLFVYDLLSKPMQKWDKCGIKLKAGDKIDLAAYEAYISLPMSSIIDTIEILPKNILVIDDYNSVFKDDVIAVEVEKNELISSQKEMEIINSIWDGQSLLDCSLFENYKNKGMLLLRNRFFKTCAFNTNIQQWFEDNNITEISQLNGKTLATKIEDIKLITTPSSIKYLKFGSLNDWLDNIDVIFGVVKHEKETHFFNGRMVQTHYQLLNTLQFAYDEMEEFIKPSLNYIDSVRSDPDVLRYHIKYPYDEMEITPLTSKNQIVFKLLGINNNFSKTKLYYDFKNDLVKSMIEKLNDGRVLVNGNYSTLFGNGLEMLKAAIGIFDGTSELVENEIHSTNFDYGITILGARSPHITMGNIALYRNKRNEKYDKYFNLTKEIVCVNAINYNIMQRLNGCDYDSDTQLLTDNKTLVSIARDNYDFFKVPTCFVSSKKTERYYTSEHQADLDVKTSVNKIGEIVNLSQQLNSLFWQNVNKGQDLETQKELYFDICKLAALSGIEIDKAKKEFSIDSVVEIKKLKEKYKILKNNKTVKPMFFKRIVLNNGYELNGKINYEYFDTSMDYIQRIIKRYTQGRKRGKNIKFEPLMSIVREPNVKLSAIKKGYYYDKKNRLIEIIMETKKSLNSLYANYENKTKEERQVINIEAFNIKQECIEYINNISSSEATMYLMLKEIEKESNSYASRFIFEVLFGYPNTTFYKMIIDSKEDLCQLKEWKHGNIELYDYLFYKEKVS